MFIQVASETNASVVYRVHINDVTGLADSCTCPSRTYRSHVACKHMLGIDAQQFQISYLAGRGRHQVAAANVALLTDIYTVVRQGPTHRPTCDQIAGLARIVNNITEDPWGDVERRVLGGLLTALTANNAGVLTAA